jgi:hypothetical protein
MDCWICGEPGAESCCAPHAACGSCIDEAGGCPTCLRITSNRVCRQDTEERSEDSLLDEQASVQILLNSLKEREIAHEALEAKASKVARGFYTKPGTLEMPVIIETMLDNENVELHKAEEKVLSEHADEIRISIMLGCTAIVKPFCKTYQIVGGPETWPSSGKSEGGHFATLKSSCNQTLYYLCTDHTLVVIDNLKKEILFCRLDWVNHLNSKFLKVRTPFHGFVISWQQYLPHISTKKYCAMSVIIIDLSKGIQTAYNFAPRAADGNDVSLFEGVIHFDNFRLNIGNSDALVARGTMLSSFRKQLEYRLDELDLAARYQLKTAPLYLGGILKGVSTRFEVRFEKKFDSIVWATLVDSIDENGTNLFVAVCRTISSPFDFYMRLTEKDGSGKECYYRCYDYEPVLDISSRTRLLGEQLEITYGKIVVLGDKNPRTYIANEIGELRTQPVPKLLD